MAGQDREREKAGGGGLTSAAVVEAENDGFQKLGHTFLCHLGVKLETLSKPQQQGLAEDGAFRFQGFSHMRKQGLEAGLWGNGVKGLCCSSSDLGLVVGQHCLQKDQKKSAKTQKDNNNNKGHL